MAAPTAPKLLQVIDRFVTVLKAIRQGTEFHYSPVDVFKRLLNFNECRGFPTYMVFIGSAFSEPEQHLDNEYVQSTTITVQGWVDLEQGEPQTKLVKCLRDVQKAINDDSKSTAAGSLGQLTSTLDVSIFETDNGNYSLQGFAFFSQQFNVRLMGDWGEL